MTSGHWCRFGAVALALIACSGEDERPRAFAATGGASGSGGASSGGTGAGSGAGGRAGAGGEAGGDASAGGGGESGVGGGAGSDGGAGTSGSGGAAGFGGAAGTPNTGGTGGGTSGAGGQDGGGATDGGGAAGSAGSEGGGLPVWSCDGDYAYWAPSTTDFSQTYPPALADALTEISGGAHPTSLVLHMKNGSLQAALSATRSGSSGLEVFLPGKAPALVPVVEAFGNPPGITSAAPLPTGYLRFVDQSGPVELAVERIQWIARQGSGCGEMTVQVYANVARSDYATIVHLSSGDRTLGELAGVGEADGGSGSGVDSGIGPLDGGACEGGAASDGGCPPPPAEEIVIAFSFSGTPMSFDFSTL
ncbi:MAG: hypothetical protein OZ921_04010 [Sorangiineae bacterium]|nr:hypothetical protein [Polyangiaceae bacterium]MEB2321656.1 hypothetical protein [Sorangiineae bacterium]